MKTFFQKHLAIALLFLPFCFSQLAHADVEEQIRDHIRNIEAAQKQIASLLVLQNFSRQFVENSNNQQFQQMYQIYSSDENAYDMQKMATSLFEITYSDKLDQKKIAELTQLAILLRGSKYQWVNMGAHLQQAQKTFFESFSASNQVCSENNFSKSLTMMESFSPEGVDTSQLKRSWAFTVGGKLSVSDNGNTSVNYYANATYPEDDQDSAEARHAVATVAGAIGNGYGGPIVGSAAAAAVEVIWGALSMTDHMKEMEKIADANEDLHSIMQFEVNVRQYFTDYCQHLKRAYIESKPLVLNINNEATRVEIFQELTRLKTLLGDNLSSDIVQDQAVYQAPETFYQFFKFKILNEALVLHQYQQNYYGSWSDVITANRNITDNLENVIYQFIEKSITDTYQPDQAVDRLISEVEQFSQFKSEFYGHILNYFNETDLTKRQLLLTKLSLLVTHYRLYHQVLNKEEATFMELADKTIAELRAKNV
jgi:hypothetical protein